MTVCVKHGQHILGRIIDGQMILSDPGKMVQQIWNEIPEKYPGVYIDAFVVMPDHVHGIIDSG